MSGVTGKGLSIGGRPRIIVPNLILGRGSANVGAKSVAVEVYEFISSAPNCRSPGRHEDVDADAPVILLASYGG